MLHGTAMLLVPDSTSDAEHTERLLGALANVRCADKPLCCTLYHSQELLHRDEVLIVEGFDAAAPGGGPAPTCTYAILAMPAPDLGGLQGTPAAAGALLIKRCGSMVMLGPCPATFHRVACADELLPVAPEALQPAEAATAQDLAAVRAMMEGVPSCTDMTWLLQLRSGVEQAARVRLACMYLASTRNGLAGCGA